MMSNLVIIFVSIISFVTGIIFACYLSLQSKKSIKNFLFMIRNKCWRFLKHTVSLIGIFMVIAIAYLIFDKINYGKEMLPNLISTALSVLIIDFLLKERTLAEQSKVNLLISNKIDSVIKNINKIILKFINLEDVERSKLTDEIISSILSKQNLAEENLEYHLINEDGQVIPLKISKFDFTFYIGKEIEPEVSNLIQNYNQYLTSEQICNLIKLKEILSSKIFKVKYSTYKNVTTAEYKLFQELLTDALIELNNILNFIKK